VRLGEVGLEAQRVAIGRYRLGESASVLQHIAERAMEDGDLALHLDRLLEARFGGSKISAAVVRGAEQMKRIGIAGSHVQRLLAAAQGGANVARRKQGATLQNQLKRWHSELSNL
jgi:hypothetical protein